MNANDILDEENYIDSLIMLYMKQKQEVKPGYFIDLINFDKLN